MLSDYSLMYLKVWDLQVKRALFALIKIGNNAGGD